MFAPTSPRILPRQLSTGSYNSNPDADIDEHEHDNYLATGGGSTVRVPTPRPSIHSRPPRNSPIVSQSLAVPSSEPPRRSFISYSEFGYHESRPPTVHQPNQVSHDRSYADVDENMEIDEEFAPRTNPTPRPSRLRRFASALFKPFRLVKSAFRIPKFLRRNRSSTRPLTQSSGWDFRDRTPAPPSIRNRYSNEGGERGEHEHATDNVTMLFPQPATAPVTMFSTNTEHGSSPGNQHVHSGSSDNVHGRSTSHHSHASLHPLSLRTVHSHAETVKANGNAIRSSGTTRTTGTSRSTGTSFSAFSPPARRPTTIKESSRERSNRAYSSMSHCSSLFHQLVRVLNAIRALYHLPWVAEPPRRIAVDFIPALSSRSKYCVKRGHQQVPSSDLIAAAAAANMEPSEGKSWYVKAPHQMGKLQKGGKGGSRHHHSRPRSFRNPYQQLFPDDPRSQQRFHVPTDGQPVYNMYSPGVPTFPQPSPYGVQPFYIFPGPPPPSAVPPPSNGTGGNGIRAPPPARPPSVMSFSLRPAPRPVQTCSGQQQAQSADPNANAARSDVQRPPPAAQPMYTLVQVPPGQPLPPSYGNMLSYPYTPPWTSPSQHV